MFLGRKLRFWTPIESVDRILKFFFGDHNVFVTEIEILDAD